MPTRQLKVAPDRLGERLIMAIMQVESGPLKILQKPMPDRLQKYRDSPLYFDVIHYLEKGLISLEGLHRNRRRQIIRRAKSYVLAPPGEIPSLRFRENNGFLSICLVGDEIERFFNSAHKDHGHIASELCLSFLVGRGYWPTRVKDVKQWCSSCHACQMKAKKPIRFPPQTIQVFEPRKKIGMDWLGPISPACSVTGCAYILILVDYFSRFMWAKAYLKHSSGEVIDMFENHVSPVFGHPMAAYSDNGSHFVNDRVRNYFQ